MGIKSTLRPLHRRLKNIGIYANAYGAVKSSISSAPSKKTNAKTAPKPDRKPMSKAEQEKHHLSGQVAVLKDLSNSGDYDAVRSSVRNILARTESRITGTSAVWDTLAATELACANHEGVMAVTQEMVATDNVTTGFYYQAQSLFVRGEYSQALQALQLLNYTRPNHADGVYLLCDVAERIGDPELAWRALEQLMKSSKRIKTWLVMANLVNSDADLFRLLDNWRNWKASSVGVAYHKDASEFIALGALRVGNYTLAKRIWRNSLMSASRSKKGFSGLTVRDYNFSPKRAEKALQDINTVFGGAGVEVFLVSGTLLGCVRENGLLGHDHDIDVGIWSDVPEQKILELATKSGRFFMLKSRASEIIRLRHVNGIAIDVFYHFRDPDDYWHGGVKMKWSNTPFALTQREFLGQTCLIPEDYDLYLQENYGDWREPKIAFDSAFDTPNGTVLSADEMVIHSFKGALDGAISGRWDKVDFYLEKLAEGGEADFVETFTQRLIEAGYKQPAQDPSGAPV